MVDDLIFAMVGDRALPIALALKSSRLAMPSLRDASRSLLPRRGTAIAAIAVKEVQDK